MAFGLVLKGNSIPVILSTKMAIWLTTVGNPARAKPNRISPHFSVLKFLLTILSFFSVFFSARRSD
jgi:hypothetical protein